MCGRLAKQREEACITHSLRSIREGFLEEVTSKLCQEADE